MMTSKMMARRLVLAACVILFLGAGAMLFRSGVGERPTVAKSGATAAVSLPVAASLVSGEAGNRTAGGATVQDWSSSAAARGLGGWFAASGSTEGAAAAAGAAPSDQDVAALEAGASGKLEPALRDLLAGVAVPVIVQFVDDDGQAEEARAELIADSGGTPERSYAGLPIHAATITREALDRLVADPRVAHISVDHPVQGSLGHTARAVGADLVWTFPLSSTGRNVTVAVIDSGVESATYQVDDLGGQLKASLSFITGNSDPSDQYGHGTHVAGIIAGSGKDSGTLNGFEDTYKGIAPGAKLINLRVLDATGVGRTSDVIAALNWCLLNRAKYNIKVINLSLGHPIYESYKTDPLCKAVEACVKNGMVVVVAAGNHGKGALGTVYGGITSPGNDPAVITVGAVNTRGTDVRSDDQIASYSSRGPTAVDGLIKPDLVAPGNKLVSTSLPTSTLYNLLESNVVVARILYKYFTSHWGAGLFDGNNDYAYLTLSGTSMAAPVASATVALMLEENPSLTPNAVKAVLAYTAERMNSFNILEQGNGYSNSSAPV